MFTLFKKNKYTQNLVSVMENDLLNQYVNETMNYLINEVKEKPVKQRRNDQRGEIFQQGSTKLHLPSMICKWHLCCN